MAKKEKKSKKKRQAKGAKARRVKNQALRKESLNFSDLNSHPWFVSINHWLTNMIMTSNPLHVELK
jgi:hypothetical protein